MSKILGKTIQTESWEETCEKFGQMLNLDGPVSDAVMRRVLEDDLYAHYLIASRNSPDILQNFLSDPRNKNYESPSPQEIKRSSTELVAKAAKAVFRWGKAGFKTVDEETFNRRWNACLQCSNLIDPPDQLVYKLVRLKKEDYKICNSCGCVAKRKAKLPTENCPAIHDTDPAVSRWGEPVEEKEEAMATVPA